MQVYTDYDEAKAGLPEGWSLCGTYRGDEPVYFFLAPDTSDEQGQQVAFQVKHGRAMSGVERISWSAAQRINERERVTA